MTTQGRDHTDAATFLTAMYGAAEPGYFFVVATFPDKKCHAFQATDKGISDALDYVRSVDDGQRHIFSSMYLLDAVPDHGRGTIADVRALTCLWADVDVGKAGYAADLNHALRIIDAIPIRPSLITSSGVGAHAYWIFSEPLSLESDHERADALDLLLHWKATVTGIAAEQGGKVDAGTFDAARVMRLSSTLNPKTNPPAPAYIISDTGERYSPSDFEPYLRDASPIASSAAFVPAALDDNDIRIPDSLPHVLALAIEQDDVIKRTWDRDRADLKDQSASGYCLSVANQCVTLGLSDAQIAQVLCAWRDLHGAVAKKDKGWYEKTIGKARSEKTVTSEAAEFVQASNEGSITDREAILAGLSEIVGLPIEAITRHGGEKQPHYRVKIEGHPSVKLGDAAACKSQQAWSNALWNVPTVQTMRDVPKEVWKTFLAQMRHVIEDKLTDEINESSTARRWVTDYLDARKVEKGVTVRDALARSLPYVDREGKINVFAHDLLRFINKPGGKAVEDGEYAAAMLGIGAVRVPLDARSRKGGTGRSYAAWKLPEAFDEFLDDDGDGE
jgi:hypothetical protein